MLKKYLIFFYSFLTLLIITIACENHNSSRAQYIKTVEEIVEKQSIPQESIKDDSLKPSDLDSSNYEIVNEIKAKGFKIEFVFISDTIYYLGKKNNLYFIFDAAAEQINSEGYTNFGPPNYLMDGLISFTRDGKAGVLDFINKSIIAESYDFVLKNNDFSFYAVKNRKRFRYYKENEKWQSIELDEINVSDMISSITVKGTDLSRKHFIYDLEYTNSQYKREESFFKWPSVIQFVSKGEKLESNYIDKDDKMKINDLGVVLLDQFQQTDKSTSFVWELVSGMDVRDYVYKEYYLSNIHNDLKIVSEAYSLPQKFESVKRVNDSLVEVVIMDLNRTYKYYDFNELFGFKIHHSTRKYAFTAFKEIDESYFKGPFYREINVEPLEYGENITYEVRDYMSVEELDIMRNEIFASYGLKFKTEKWQKYFGKQPWYRPLYDNVDHLLTEIDKKNIALILAFKKKVLTNAKKYNNAREEEKEYYYAG